MRTLAKQQVNFISLISTEFTERVKIRELAQSSLEMSFMDIIRLHFSESAIEQALNAMGHPTDPTDPNATSDPLEARITLDQILPYRPPHLAHPEPTRAPKVIKPVVQALIELGIQIEPEELNLPNFELSLLEQGRINESQLALAYSRAKGVQLIDLKRTPPDPNLKDLLNDQFVTDSQVVPYRAEQDGTLVCVVSTMNTLFLSGRLEDKLHRQVSFVITPRSELLAYIDRTYNQSKTFENLELESRRRAATRPQETEPEEDQEDGAMAQTFQSILREAINNRASDIHVQPSTTITRIRMRVDGTLRDFRTIPGNLHRQFTNFLRVKANISNTQEHQPQDAQMELDVGGRTVNIRLNILPTIFGAKSVLRLLSSPEQILPIDALGLSDNNRRLLQWGMEHKNGILIISGPTGSGKTNTLYTLTRELDRPDINIITIENPVEIRMASITQVQLTPDAANPDRRLTDQTALRAAMRQDPDVILIGEMRDPETVRLGMQAAQTGHLVLATTHTNSAAESMTRLKDLGATPYDIAPAVRLLIAQRLIRRPCPDCCATAPLAPNLFDPADLPAGTPVMQPTDRTPTCLSCDGTGHKGRIAIVEILPVLGDVRDAVRRGAPETDLITFARAHGFRSLYEDALDKLRQGLTTPHEIRAYTAAQHQSPL